MSYGNLSGQMTPAQLAAILAKAEELRTLLVPWMASLPAGESENLYKVGTKRRGWLNKVTAHATNNPTWLSSLNFNDYKDDVAVYDQMDPVISILMILASGTHHARIISGNEAITKFGLPFKAITNALAMTNTVGAKEVANDLNVDFDIPNDPDGEDPTPPTP